MSKALNSIDAHIQLKYLLKTKKCSNTCIKLFKFVCHTSQNIKSNRFVRSKYRVSDVVKIE